MSRPEELPQAAATTMPPPPLPTSQNAETDAPTCRRRHHRRRFFFSSPDKPLSKLPRKREAIRRFTPSWFTVVMGTGSVALTIATFPYGDSGLGDAAAMAAARRVAALAVWALSCLLFLLFGALLAGRAAFYPETLAPMARHPTQSLFLGAIPMALCTLTNGVAIVLAPHLGPAAQPAAASAALALYWLNAPAAALAVLLLPWYMFTAHGGHHSTERVTALFLLPVVPACVQAGSAGTVAAAFAAHYRPRALESLLLSGYAFGGVGLLLSLQVTTLYFQRLLYHSLPPKEVIVSSFLPLGPYAMTSLALVRLGAAAEAMLAAAYGGGGGKAGAGDGGSDPLALPPSWNAGALPARAGGSAVPRYVSMLRAADGGGLALGLALWGFALWWLAVAIACVGSTLRTLSSCGLGLWGGVFPVGVLTLNTAALAEALDVPALRGGAAALAACHWLLWAYVLALTVRGAWTGALFAAPCLAGEEQEEGDLAAEEAAAEAEAAQQAAQAAARAAQAAAADAEAAAAEAGALVGRSGSSGGRRTAAAVAAAEDGGRSGGGGGGGAGGGGAGVALESRLQQKV